MRITDARIVELLLPDTEALRLDESEELIWLLHDKLKELNNLPRYQPRPIKHNEVESDIELNQIKEER